MEKQKLIISTFSSVLIFVNFMTSVVIVNGQNELISSPAGFVANDLCDEFEDNVEKYKVFNRTVCSLSADNIIDIETRVENEGNNEVPANNDLIAARGDYSTCQNNCFRDQSCQNFTYFHHTDDINGVHTFKCILFRSCGKQLKCVTCITGPPAPLRPKNCEKKLMKEILAEVIDTTNDIEMTGEQLGKLIQKELGSERRADFWSNILAATAPSERANKVMEVLGIKFPEDSEEDFEEDFSSNNHEDDSGAEDFGSLINASNEETKKTTMDHLMTSVENIQKSVNQLAAAVTVTKNIEDNVTPSPDESIPTTSRRSVDIDSLIANKKDDDKVETKGNNKKRKNKAKKSKDQKPRQPKQLEDEFDDAEDDIEDDDYVDPFNVDDGLLQDENIVEEFPDEDDEMENSGNDAQEEEPNVERLPEEDDEEYADPDSEEVPEEEYDEEDGGETEETTKNPKDDAETVTTSGTKPRRRPTFFHCIMGGYGPFGPIRSIGHIGFGAVTPFIGRARPRVPKLIASIPSSFPLGLQGTYTTMLGGSMYLCSPGAATTTVTRVRSFFDFQPFFEEQPKTTMESGRCSVYNTGLNVWQPFGSSMNTYRAGGSMTRMGKFIIATGGRRFPSSRFPTESVRRSVGRSFSRRRFDLSGRAIGRRRFVTSPTYFLSRRFKRQALEERDPGLNTIEVLSTRKPGKWRALTRFQLPNATYEHCTVAINKTSLMIIGGYGQESNAAMVDLKYKTHTLLEPLKQPRRKHSCTKVRFNGRNGIIVAGGSSDANPALSSLEFYDLNTGKWYSLGRMTQGRRFPAITLMNGKLMITGGETTDALGQTVIFDTMEMLKGRRWARLKQRLPEERSRFSIQRIPQKFLLT